MPMPVWLQAGTWGIVAGSALVLGAAIAYFTPVSHRVVASVMGFGGGVLIAVLAFELLDGTLEAIIIGLSLAVGPGVSVVAVVGFFVSNVPEGLSSAAGMKLAGRS